MTEGDDDWSAVAGNLVKARKSWGGTAGGTQQGGSNEAGVGELFQGGGAAGTSVWGGDVGGVPKNGVGTERVHPWGGDTDNRKTTASLLPPC